MLKVIISGRQHFIVSLRNPTDNKIAGQKLYRQDKFLTVTYFQIQNAS